MKLKYQFEIIALNGSYRAVPVDGEGVCGILSMNQSGAEIFEILRNETEVEAVFAELKNKYPQEPEEKLKRFIEKTLRVLEQANLIVK